MVVVGVLPALLLPDDSGGPPSGDDAVDVLADAEVVIGDAAADVDADAEAADVVVSVSSNSRLKMLSRQLMR